MAASRQGRAAIENADIVESQESTLEDVLAFRVLPIHPPREVQHELVKHALQELAVATTAAFLLDLVHAPRGPGVHRRIDVAERPFVRWNLPVRMHVPLAQ